MAKTITMPDLVSPIIHLNGTSAQTLSDNLCDAYAAVTEAMEKLRQCAPNGRDYYPQPGLMALAEAQHRARGDMLKAVLDSLEAEAESIAFS